MKLAAYTNNNYNTFAKAFNYFVNQYFAGVEDDANLFIDNLREQLDVNDAPCDQLILNCFLGYNNKFSLVFTLKGVKIGYTRIAIDKYGIMKLDDYGYDVEEFKNRLHNVVEKYLDFANNVIWLRTIKECNLDQNNNNKVIVYKYNNSRLSEQTTILKGTITEIFDNFISMNDTLRYCNGVWWSFENRMIQKLYSIYINKSKCNIFLNNAVKRGVIID